MSKAELLKRYILLIASLLINSFGVSFITKASLGTSPISSIPYTLSLGFRPSFGMFTLYMSIILIAIQIILLRRNFPKQYLLQIPVSFLFSWFIDLSMAFLSFLSPDSYLMKLALLILGCGILGAGVYLEMAADVVLLPGEAFVKSIAVTFRKDFGKTKVVADTSMSIVAAIIGLAVFHKIVGVREGTIIAALLVGMTARFLKRKLQFIEEFIFPASAPTDVYKNQQSENKFVVTIGREYGSGGRKIAQELAKSLGFDYYDRNIIQMAAQQTHMPESYIEAKEEKMTSSLMYDLFSQYQALTEDETELDKLYDVEAKIIKEAAANGNVVIVGRCADYILKDNRNCFHVFVHAAEDYKVRRIMEREGLDYDAAMKHVKDINKKRFKHYQYYTGRVWGHATNYNLCLDVSMMEPQQAVAMIKQYTETSNLARPLSFIKNR